MDAEKLINSVQAHPALWDTRKKNYHQRDVHRKLWASVAEELGVQVGEAKKKWQGLRDIFRKEYKKALEHKGGHETIGPADSPWSFFGQMLFLKDILCQLQSNAPSRKTKFDDSNLSESAIRSASTPLDPKEYDEEVSCNSTPANALSDSTEPNQAAKKQKRSAEQSVDELYLQLERRKVELLTENASLQQNSDYQFIQSLVPFLMKVPLDRKLIVRHKLLQVLIEEQERGTEMQPYPTAVPSTSTMSPPHLFPDADQHQQDIKSIRYDLIG